MARSSRSLVQVGAVVSATVISQLALALSGPLVVRLLGVDARGRLAELFAVVLLVSQVGMAGYPQAWGYYLAVRGVPPATMLRHHGRLYLIHAMAASAIATVVAYILSSIDHFDEVWLSSISVGLAVASVFAARMAAAVLEGTSRFVRLAVVLPIPALAYATVVVAFTVGHSGSVGALLLLNALAWMLSGVVTALMARPAFKQEKGGESPSAGALRRYAWRVAVAVSSPIDNLGIDQLLVALLLSQHDLGYYAIGLAFESGPVLVLGSIARIVATKVALARAEDRVALARRWTLLAVVCGAATVGLIELFLAPVLTFAFGSEGVPALGLARGLVVVGFVLGLRMVTYACLQGAGRPGTATLCELAGLGAMALTLMVGAGPIGVAAAPLALGTGGLIALVSGAFGFSLDRESLSRAPDSVAVACERE